MHREICVKDFSGTIAHTFLILLQTEGHDYLYRIREVRNPLLIIFFISSFFFFFSNKMFRQ